MSKNSVSGLALDSKHEILWLDVSVDDSLNRSLTSLQTYWTTERTWDCADCDFQMSPYAIVNTRKNVSLSRISRLGMKIFYAPEHLLRNEHGGPEFAETLWTGMGQLV